MIINDEEKNVFTQSVMGDTEGGGGVAVYVAHDEESGELDATFNELVEYFNNDKLVFISGMGENDGTTTYGWNILTIMQRVSYNQSVIYYARFTYFPFYDGSQHLETMLFAATDPDEKMMLD